MKKLLAILLTLSLLFSLSVPALSSSDESGSFTFYFWDENQKPIMQNVVDLFNKEYPNVAVEMTVIPYSQYWAKLQTSLSSENGPDVFWCNKPYAVEYLPRGLVQELDSYIEADGVDMSVFPDALRALYSYEGVTYGIPKDYDTIGLFYNKALFDAKGVAYPTDDWTWTEFEAAAEALTGDGVHGYVVDLASTQSCVYNFIIANGGTCMTEDETMYDISSPEAAGAIKWLMGLIDKGYSPTGAAITEISADDRFAAGLAAMVTAGSWTINTKQEALGVENVGVAAIPASVQEGNVIHGLGICISAASAKKDLAWKFVKTFTTADAAIGQSKVVIPAHNDGGQYWAEAFNGLDVSCLLEAAQYATPYPSARVAPAAQDDILASALNEILLGGNIDEILNGLPAKFQAAKDAA